MREKMDANVSRPVRLGVSVVAAVLLAPIVLGLLASLAFVLTPFAALALPFVAAGLRGDSRGKPRAREVLARPFPMPVKQIRTVSVCGNTPGLAPCEPAIASA